MPVAADAFQQLPDGPLQLLQLQRLIVQRVQLPEQQPLQGTGTGTVQRGGDVAKRHPQAPQSPDAVQPPQVLFGVAAVAGSRADSCPEQADAVVVVERPDRHTGCRRQLPDAP